MVQLCIINAMCLFFEKHFSRSLSFVSSLYIDKIVSKLACGMVNVGRNSVTPFSSISFCHVTTFLWLEDKIGMAPSHQALN